MLFLQVNINNLEEYISLAVDATVKAGVMRQMEAFRAGFNQVAFQFFSRCTLAPSTFPSVVAFQCTLLFRRTYTLS